MVHQLIQDSEHLRLVELVAKRLPRAALLDAVKAGEVAFVGDLPGDVERCRQVLGSAGGWNRGPEGLICLGNRSQSSHRVNPRATLFAADLPSTRPLRARSRRPGHGSDLADA